MKVLVTGMAGFIGFHCAAKLLREGHEVLGIDNLNDYYSPALKEARIEELKKIGSVRFEKCDLTDGPQLDRLFAEFKPDRVLHLAAQAGVRYSIHYPHVYMRANFVGTLNILECCRHHGKPRLVYASSSSVYGGNTKLPFSETDPVDHPVSLYAASKKANELKAHTYTHLYGIPTVGLRFFTVYGPWGRPDMAMWLFADAILKDRPIKVFNHGNMQRDFTFVDDIVQGVMASLFTPDLDPYEIFNLGNHRSEPLMDLIGLIEKTLGKTAQKEFMPMQDGDVPATYADIKRAQTKLNFQPKTSILDGVPAFLNWFKAHPEFHGI